jgi:hypothetical protein
MSRMSTSKKCAGSAETDNFATAIRAIAWSHRVLCSNRCPNYFAKPAMYVNEGLVDVILRGSDADLINLVDRVTRVSLDTLNQYNAAMLKSKSKSKQKNREFSIENR